MIELTVIGGYLGAGKTTLLNEILDRTDGERVAVIVNDFGTVNIDAEIISSRNGSTMEISNGCICCDLSDGMAGAIERIRAAEPPVSRVYVEVSGVGQPEVVARWGDHPGFSRGGSVVCADVTSIRRDVNRKWVGETVLSQLSGADRLLLTKTDLVDDRQLREVEDWLTTQLDIDAEIIDRGRVLVGGQMRQSEPPTTASSTTDSSHAASAHTSWSITTTAAVDPVRLCALVLDLPEIVVRAKGILTDSRDPDCRFLIQYDGTRCETDDVVAAGAASDEPGHLVVIAAGDHVKTPSSVTALAQTLHGWVGD